MKLTRILYKGWGFVLEKRFDSWFPLWYIFLGRDYCISYAYFHSGVGFHILLPGINIMIATKGKIAWWLNPGRGKIDILNFHKEW